MPAYLGYQRLVLIGHRASFHAQRFLVTPRCSDRAESTQLTPRHSEAATKSPAPALLPSVNAPCNIPRRRGPRENQGLDRSIRSRRTRSIYGVARLHFENSVRSGFVAPRLRRDAEHRE